MIDHAHAGRPLGYLVDLLNEHITGTLLTATLEATVPFAILDLHRQGRPFASDWARVRSDELIERFASTGDNLLYKGHKRGQTAALMQDLIRVMAILAFAPGGITAWGLHFDAGVPDATGAAHCISPPWLAQHLKESEEDN